MSCSLARRIAPVVAAALIALTACSQAAPYEFKTSTPEVAKGQSVVEVQLMNNKSGTVVSDAVITATRLDMGPDGMQSMATTVEPQDSGEPGVQRFNANFTMAGRWSLSLSAQVPGEAEPVTGAVIITAR